VANGEALMADSTAAPNNKAVAFRGKPEREPAGVSNAAPMKPPKSKRKQAKRAIKRGMISEKAAKRHLGDY
jgi:hypothetical protein